MKTFSLGLSLLVLACSGEESASSSGSSSGTTKQDAGTRDAASSIADDATGSSAGGDGDGTGGICSQLTVASDRLTPDMLIVLDRSSSMRGQGVDRWGPSVRGIKTITTALDDVIRFGLMPFPGSGGSTTIGGGLACAPGTLEVPIQVDNAPPIASKLDTLQLIESTPTAATLAAAHKVLSDGTAQGGDSALATQPYVVLVTDGAPNCSNGAGGRGGNDTAAVAASVAEIAAMATDGIKTYVLGYDTQSDAQLKSALDQMARAGGTGDTAHRAIEDEQSLIAAFRDITGAVLSCDFKLADAAADASYVRVTLSGTQVSYDESDGWTLSSDGRTLSLHGAACDAISDSSKSTVLSVTIECAVVQTI